MIIPLDKPLTVELYAVLHYRNVAFMALAALATSGASFLPQWDQLIQKRGGLRTALGFLLITMVLPYCAAFVMAGSGNPFIYYRF